MKKSNSIFATILVIFTLLGTSKANADNAQQNLSRCLSGHYPSLCDYSLLSTEDRARAKEAERQVNLKRCLTGNYPSLCDYSLLSSSELASTKEAERRVNLNRCLTGNYPSLCDYGLLSSSELASTKEAERRVNLNRCLTCNYPSLCDYSLLSSSELKKVKAAEAKAATALKNMPAIGRTTTPPRGECYESYIVKPSPFMGNDGEIFKLDDGSFWEVKYEYEYMYEYNPDVIICPSKGKLVVDGKSLNVEYVGGR